MNPFIVAPDHYQSSSFLRNDELQANGLNSSIAVALYRPGHGGLAYLTQRFVGNEKAAANFRNWLENGEVESVAAIVGGWRGTSERLIEAAAGILDKYSIPIEHVETLTHLTRNVALRHNGTLSVFYFRDVKRGVETQSEPAGELELDLAGGYAARQAAARIDARIPRR